MCVKKIILNILENVLQFACRFLKQCVRAKVQTSKTTLTPEAGWMAQDGIMVALDEKQMFFASAAMITQ